MSTAVAMLDIDSILSRGLRLLQLACNTVSCSSLTQTTARVRVWVIPPAVKRNADGPLDARRVKILNLMGDLPVANPPRCQTQFRFGREGCDQQEEIVCGLSIRTIILAVATYFLSSIDL